jgi:hypothetical protein
LFAETKARGIAAARRQFTQDGSLFIQAFLEAY